MGDDSGVVVFRVIEDVLFLGVGQSGRVADGCGIAGDDLFCFGSGNGLGVRGIVD